MKKDDTSGVSKIMVATTACQNIARKQHRGCLRPQYHFFFCSKGLTADSLTCFLSCGAARRQLSGSSIALSVQGRCGLRDRTAARLYSAIRDSRPGACVGAPPAGWHLCAQL